MQAILKLKLYNLMILDGCFCGEYGYISWHMVDEEFQ